MTGRRPTFAEVREFCMFLALLGLAIPLSGLWTIVFARSVKPMTSGFVRNRRATCNSRSISLC